MLHVPVGNRGHVALVDDEDAQLVIDGRSWSLNGQYAYSHHLKRYMHRWLTGDVPDMDVDHINHECLDNRRINLRVVSHAVNMQNQRSHRDARSAHRGVWWEPKTQRWVVHRTRDGRKHYLGSYQTELEAAVASEAFDGIPC